MSRFSFLIAAMCLLLLGSCGKNKQAGQGGTATDSVVVNCESRSFLMTLDKLPAQLDTTIDLSTLTMQELRLLHYYPYALHGLWIMEADVNSFYTAKTDWYYEGCYNYLEAHNWEPLLDYNKVELTGAERRFLERIDQRISALQGYMWVNQPEGRLANPWLTVNLFQMSDLPSNLMDALQRQNFAIISTNCNQLFNVYEGNDYQQMPNYITTDLFLQAYHMYFSYALKSVEVFKFIPALHEFNRAMYDQAVSLSRKEADPQVAGDAAFVATFFAVADRLLTDSRWDVPEQYAAEAEAELANIMAEQPAMSPMMNKDTEFAYDLFRPRGHYTRSDARKRYFRCMMWLQSFTFCREQRSSIEFMAAMGYVLNHADAKGVKQGRAVYDLLTYFMGEADNPSIINVADFMREQHLDNPADITRKETLDLIDRHLQKQFLTANRITPKVADPGCTDKVNLMPQRYTADAEVLSKMYDERPNADRPFPRGLDVMDAFGISLAGRLADSCYQDSKLWSDYSKQAEELRKQFSHFADWDKCLYSRWLKNLIDLQQVDKSWPAHMQTTAWQTHLLNTALASWAELKHDAVLYAEQPMAAECGGGEELPDPIVVGYVEPNLRFWQSMKQSVEQVRDLLKSHGFLTDDLAGHTNTLLDYMNFCIKVTQKELADTPLTEEEYREIEHMGGSLEWFTLGVIDPESEIYSWWELEGPDRSVAQVSDVFTRSVLGCNRCGILHEATGNADAIFVVVPINGHLYLTRGATMSYYEFVEPLGTRLTDEEWQQRLQKGKAPARPAWMLPLLLDTDIEVNEAVFYSTGC